MHKITPFLSSRVQKLPDKGVEKVSGALLLSDISGFTALSETLAKKGKEGTEELTRILNNYFGVMLRTIQKHGGDVLKFSGDALLVAFYEDPTKQQRAAKSCAARMMKEMDRFKSIETGVGRFDVLMKVAVASGEWNELILGDNRRKELFLCGTTVRDLIFMEERAKSGEIITAKEAIPDTPPRRGRKLNKQSSYQAIKFPHLPVSLTSFLPQGVADLIDREPFGEHRAVSAVFLNFDGYDEENPEVESLQRLFREIISITERYGGAVHKIDLHPQGSKIMVLFGAPVSHEGDAERAVLAGMEFSKRPIGPLRVKVGVCTGFVYAGTVGSDWRKEYTVIGDVVNTAERLMETANYGRSIVSESTEYLTRGKIEYGELESIKVKGKEESLRRFMPLGTKEEKYFRFEFVGREKELREVIKATKVGGKAIIIKGVGGIGKSRLLYEIKKNVEYTHKVLEGYTNDIKGSLWLFTSMLAKEANIHPDESREIRKKKLEQHIREIEIEKEIEKGELYRRLSIIGAMLFGIRYTDSLYEKLDAKLRFENLCDGLRYYIEYQMKAERRETKDETSSATDNR